MITHQSAGYSLVHLSTLEKKKSVSEIASQFHK